VVSDSNIINICRSKWETYLFLKKNNLPYPYSGLPEDVDGLINDVGFPLVVKPVVGSASQNVYLARNKKELDVFIDRIDNPIIQEHLEPVEEEYTSSIVMFDKEILGIITIKRELKCGNSYRAFIDDFDSVRDQVLEVGKKIGPFGPCNIQMRHTDKGPITFEVNLRFSGTTALRAYVGFNEVEAVIDYLLFDKKTHLKYNKGVVMRYWNEVYTNFSEYEKLVNDMEIENPESNIIDYF
jgi:carbamoyl-phosphate synthase large subunit